VPVVGSVFSGIGQRRTMLALEPGIYLRLEPLPNGPKPNPVDSGFSHGVAYRALGMFNPSETSDAYFILSNDRDEIWFICNRHLRCVGVIPCLTVPRVPVAEAMALLPQPVHIKPPQAVRAA
jgi:hypothetical protein